MSVRGAIAKFNPVPDRIRQGDEPMRPFPGSVADWAAGNGCLVRISPITLFLHKYPAVAIDRCVDSSKVTHGSQIARDACRSVYSPLYPSLLSLLSSLPPLFSINLRYTCMLDHQALYTYMYNYTYTI